MEAPKKKKTGFKIPTDSPVIDDLVGVSKKFADELMLGLKNEQFFNMLATHPNKIFMINGPPGTGKTYTINAINNTANKKTLEYLTGKRQVDETSDNPLKLNLAVLSYNIGTHGTAYINMGSVNVQEFFDTAYHLSHKIPILIKIDEADALLGKRNSSLQTHKEDNKVLETLMKNLQTSHDTPNIYVAMMTNLKEFVDPAILRAGRIDKHYTFNLPGKDERRLLYIKIISNKNKIAKYDVIRKYDIKELSDKSKGFNHADISSVIEKTLSEKARQLIKDKKPGIISAGYVTQKRLLDNIEYHKKEFGYKKKKQKIGFI